MKSILSRANKKIILVLLVIMILLSTVAVYNIYAETTDSASSAPNDVNSASSAPNDVNSASSAPNDVRSRTSAPNSSKGSEENAPGDGRYYTFQDLQRMYEILCCYHGGAHSALPGENVTLTAGGRSTTTTNSGKYIGALVKSDEGKETALTYNSTSSSSPYSGTYTVKSEAFYTPDEVQIARPKEAYILAEMIEEKNGNTVFYGDGYSAIQYAWWTTIAGSYGTARPSNSLSEEAAAFEAYIAEVAKSTDPATFEEQNYKFEKDGVIHEGTVPAPVINFDAKRDEDVNEDGVVDEKDKVQVSWDSNKQTWTVGPFKLNYVEKSFSSEDRDFVEFSSITEAKLYTNLGEVDKNHWRFNWIEGERDVDDTYEFPHQDELFYVELDFIEGTTEITNFHFGFKYMNAGGKYEHLHGVYFKETWTPASKVVETCPGPEGNETTCSHGNTSSHNTKWKYWLKLTGMEEDTAQLLAYGIIGARWYQETSVDFTVSKPTGSFKICKKIVDSEGNELKNVYQNTDFKFEIYKNDKLYNTVWVSPNKPYVSPKITWENEEKAPVFTVKEVLKDGTFKQYGDIEVTGSLEEKTLTFTAKNYSAPHEGKISITKDQVGSGISKNATFSFILRIDNKIYIEPGKTDENGIITIKLGEKWESNPIYWSGKKAPTYNVHEVNLPSGVEAVSIINGRGSLIDQKTVNVVGMNRRITTSHSGTLTIKKEIEGLASSDEEFTFLIKVGNDSFTRKIKAGETWSEKFYWDKGSTAPSYEVTEIDIPNGWELIGIENASGTIAENSNIDVIAKNQPTEQSATIEITKHTISNSSTDEEFTIDCEISGKFTINGEEIDGTKTISTTLHAEEKVTLGPISWKGEAPTYKVTETKIPTGWNLQDITNSSGKLEDNKIVEVLCTNYKDVNKKASFKIYKQIVDKNGNLLKDVDQDKVFKFIVYINGNIDRKITVTPNKPYFGYVYLRDNEEYPTVTVEEVLDEESDYKQFGEIEQTGSLEESTLTFTAKNYVDKGGYISIEKRQIGTGLEDETFNFKIYIDNELYVEQGKTKSDGTIELKVGEIWTSQRIEWTSDVAPKYTVSEVNLPEGSKLVNIENASGSLVKDEIAPVIAINEKETTYEKGTIKLEKKLDGNVNSDDSFNFEIKVGENIFYKTLKAGQSWTETFVWEHGTEAPKYEVIETDIPDDWKLVEIKNASGTLANNQTINIVAINEAVKEKEATIKIHKETVSDEKDGIDENDLLFTFETRISGTFEMGGESIVNGTKTITSTLKAGETVTLDTIKWKGSNPTYSVTEVELPEGWKLQSITNNSGEVEDERIIEVNCVNEFRIREEFELTMEMAGMVWEDTALNPEDKNTENSKPNGKYDSGREIGIEKVEVVIWKKCYDENGNEILELRKHATGYEEGTNTVIEFPLYTSFDGIWKAPRMAVPGLTYYEKESGAVKADYDVEFTYDGQTYRPTDFLVSGSVEEFRKATNAGKSKYLNDSMAYEVEEERISFDNKFETITGDTSIDDNGTTEGYAIGTNGERTELLYKASDSMETVEGNTRKISELQTLEDGYIRQQYKMNSRTSTGGLTYPFDDKIHLVNVKREIDKIEGGLKIRYIYSATYPYLLNVNLGLVKRDEAELALTKDVYSASAVVNQKLLNYKFNEYVDFESDEYKDYLNLQLKVADANISYKLDLYESDYYYRAQVYDGNSAVKGALQDFYATLGKTNLADELDLDVFLTYKISIYNNSDSYLALVKSVTDYFDDDLELVDSEIKKYVQNSDGNIVDGETVVAIPAYVIKKGPTDSSRWGEKLRNSIQGKISVDYGTKYISSQGIIEEIANNPDMEVSENVTKENQKYYYKANIDLNNDEYKLASGEKLEVYLTYKIRTDEAPTKLGGNMASDELKSYVRLGTKANIAEIASYSTYYHDTGLIAGKVDKDSAPNNIDIENKNEKSWYEDDTDSAPIITLDLYSETRDIEGFAWEDNQTEQIDYNQVIGNGMYDDGERLIGNLTTQIVEKIDIKQPDGTYKEYDFVWPTNKKFDFLNNQTFEEITGFDSITLTSNRPENLGTYKFTNIPAGNYVIRFEYGNFPADDVDEYGKTIRLNGVSESKTSDDGNRTPAVYNGQDFKATAYEADIKDINGKSYYSSNSEGYIDNEWYDFSTVKYDENGDVINHNSDIIDNEARRLEVIAYSRVLDNTNTTVLASANNYSADHTELYNNTSMFADTPKINLNIENMNSLKGQKIIVTDEITGETKEVLAGSEETRNSLLTNTIFGKSNVNGDKGTVSIVNYNYKIEAIDAGIEERSNTEFVLDKEIEAITLTTNSGEQILKAVFDIDYEFNIDSSTGKSTYEAIVKLNNDKSYGTSNLMYQNKDEQNGIQNFRYIYYDDNISQGLNIEIVYRFSVLNVGEVDRTGKVANMTVEDILAKAQEIKDNTYNKVGDKLVSKSHSKVGEYLGSIYYLGKRDSYLQQDDLVKTKARQMIDYVDNDAVFKASNNTGKDYSWKSVTVDELLSDKLIDSSIVKNVDGKNVILDNKGRTYTTEQRSNIVLSVEGTTGEELTNPGFIVDLLPYSASKENGDTTDVSCMATMSMVITRSIDSQISDDDLSYDNIAELIKLENTVGKRDIETISGNIDPKGGSLGEGEFAASIDERDSSATEVITFTPPYGLGVKNSLRIEIFIVGLVALTILGTGIVLIKKYVIK